MRPEDLELRTRMRDLVEDQTIGSSELRKRLKDLLKINEPKTEKGKGEEKNG